MRDGYLHTGAVAGCDHGVGLRQCWREGFFAEDAAHAGLGSGDDHVVFLVQPARRDADDVQLLLCQHLAVVLIAVCGVHAEALAGGGQTFGVGVGDGDKVDFFHAQVDGVEAVAVVAAAGMADDTGSVCCHVNSSSLTIYALMIGCSLDVQLASLKSSFV